VIDAREYSHSATSRYSSYEPLIDNLIALPKKGRSKAMNYVRFGSKADIG
jgi:hypothetical protein